MMIPAGLFERGQAGEQTSRCWGWEPGSEPGVQDGDARTKTRGITAQMLTGTGTGHIACHNLGGDFTDGLADNIIVLNEKSTFSLFLKSCQSEIISLFLIL